MDNLLLKIKGKTGQHVWKVLTDLNHSTNFRVIRLVDIQCTEPPPPVPTHSEYTVLDDDGAVEFSSTQYPSLAHRSGVLVNSTASHVDIPRNYGTHLR